MKCPFELPVRTDQVPNVLLQGLKKPIHTIQGKKNDRGVSEIYAFCDDKDMAEAIVQAINSHEKLRELARLRGDLLVCYRIGKNPTGKLLDKLDELNKFEQALKEAEKPK